MEVKAKLNKLQISPRKVRLVIDVVRGSDVEIALEQLRLMPKKSALPIYKLVASALANAKNNHDLETANLFIKEIRVDEGVTLKRWMPRAMGRATPLMKRSSIVSIILAEKVESKKSLTKKSDKQADKKDIKTVSADEIKKTLGKDDQDRVEQKDKAAAGKMGKFKEKFNFRKSGGE